jgi:retron-type reverse transcriptase
MALRSPFLTLQNFDLALTRVIRSQNSNYKNFVSHLFPSYSLASRGNLEYLINDLRTGAYRPEPPTIVFQPKANGGVRPLRLLTLQDLIVYQAIVNIIANRFSQEQQRLKFKRCFAAIFAGKTSPFFYLSWKVCYREYSDLITKAFRSKNVFVGDFDLVAFYDLIDHQRLRTSLEVQVKDADMLDLLFDLACTPIYPHS